MHYIPEVLYIRQLPLCDPIKAPFKNEKKNEEFIATVNIT